MKVSKNSWHYRFNDFNNAMFEYRFNRGRYTTCSYIRTTIASIITSVLKAAIIAIMACATLGIVGSMIAVPVIIFLGDMPPDIPLVFCILGWVSTVIALSVLLVNQLKDWNDERQRRAYDQPIVHKEPNVFVQAVIDKHNKYCTLVTAED